MQDRRPRFFSMETALARPHQHRYWKMRPNKKLQSGKQVAKFGGACKIVDPGFSSWKLHLPGQIDIAVGKCDLIKIAVWKTGGEI